MTYFHGAAERPPVLASSFGLEEKGKEESRKEEERAAIFVVWPRQKDKKQEKGTGWDAGRARLEEKGSNWGGERFCTPHASLSGI